MNWIELKLQENINDLMDKFNEFHDSCIIECSYITGMYVDEKKKMGQDSKNSIIRLVFQSQICDPIEICFESIKEINIHTYDNYEYFNNICDATFFIENGLIYWANSSEWSINKENKEISYIICKKAKYRNI
ncbi:MAG: hypothetical protein ACLU8F_04025 [Clostridia bacterium]